MTIEQQVERYMALPYRVELIPAEEGGFVVRIPDLPGCISQGETAEEAVEMIRDAQHGWLTVSLEQGDTIPEPRPLTSQAYSGKFNVRIPKELHRQLVEVAEHEGVSLNHYVVYALARTASRDDVLQQVRSQWREAITSLLPDRNVVHEDTAGFETRLDGPAVRAKGKGTAALTASVGRSPKREKT